MLAFLRRSPKRSVRASRHGFRMAEAFLDTEQRDGVAAYKGRMLTYLRQ
jgi:hypothetical protein